MTSLFTTHRQGTGRPVVFLHGLASTGGRDWPDAEWSAVVPGRPRLVIDLPAHGRSAAVGALPTSGVIDLLAETVVEALGTQEIDLVGYSLGARLAWDLSGHRSLNVVRLVLGGLAAREPFAMVDLDAARLAVAGGAAPGDPLTGMIVQMATLSGSRPQGILDLIEGLASEPFDPTARPPRHSVLLLGGTEDAMAAEIDDLAALLPDGRAARVPGDHLEALHSARFREAAGEALAH